MSGRQAAALIAIAKHLGTQPELGALVAGAAALARQVKELKDELRDVSLAAASEASAVACAAAAADDHVDPL